MKPRQLNDFLFALALLSYVNFINGDANLQTNFSDGNTKSGFKGCPHDLEKTPLIGLYHPGEDRCFELLDLSNFAFDDYYVSSSRLCQLMGGHIFSFTVTKHQLEIIFNATELHGPGNTENLFQMTFLAGKRLTYVQIQPQWEHISVRVEYLLDGHEGTVTADYRIFNKTHWKIDNGTDIGIDPNFFTLPSVVPRRKYASLNSEQHFVPPNCIISKLNNLDMPTFRVQPCNAQPAPAATICRVKRMTNCIDAHYNKVLKMTICNNCTEGRPPFCHDIGFNENERKTALCDLMDCGMFGICVLQGEHAVCECEEKFATGLLCDNITESVLCEKVTCYHDGTCRKVGDSQAKCVCMEGYTGEVCAQDVNECNYAPCGEYGTCTNSFGSYICQCRNGESGRTCPEESQMAGIIHERAVYGTVGGMLLFIVVSVVVILYEWRKKRKENKRLQKMTPNAPRTPSAEPPTPNAQNQAARTS